MPPTPKAERSVSKEGGGGGEGSEGGGGGGGGGGLGTHWSEDEGGEWGSVGEALKAVWVVGYF